MGFRALGRRDLPALVGWLGQAHVARWWGEAPDAAGAEARYGPCIDAASATSVFVIIEGGEPAGMIQTYPLSAYPEYEAETGTDGGAGLDLLLAEGRTGRGLGSEVIRRFATEMVPIVCPRATSVVACPAPDNRRSVRALAAAGFRQAGLAAPPGVGQRLVMILELSRHSPAPPLGQL